MSRNEEWERIEERYEDYLRAYPEESSFEFQIDETIDYPLKWAHRTGTPLVLDAREPIDTEYLVSFDESFDGFDQFYLGGKADLPILLTKLGQVKSTADHRVYWKYSFEEINDFFGSNTDQYENVLDILETAVALSCTVTTENPDPSFFEEKSYFLASYVTFPLIETLLKEFCEEDIRMDGTVKPGRRIRRLGSADSYYEEGDICSDIGSLFFHMEEEVADEYLTESLEHLRTEIAKFGDGDGSEAYGLIKDGEMACSTDSTDQSANS